MASLAGGRGHCLSLGALVSPGQGRQRDSTGGCWGGWGALGFYRSPCSWLWFLGDWSTSRREGRQCGLASWARHSLDESSSAMPLLLVV